MGSKEIENNNKFIPGDPNLGLPPRPEKWPTAEELRQVAKEFPLPTVKGGVRRSPCVGDVIIVVGGPLRRVLPRIK